MKDRIRLYKQRKYDIGTNVLEPADIDDKILYPEGIQNRTALIALMHLLLLNDKAFYRILGTLGDKYRREK